MIAFKGESIPGYETKFEIVAADVSPIRFSMPGVIGERSIAAGRKGRDFNITMMFYDSFASGEALLSSIDLIQSTFSEESGQLVRSGIISKTYRDCQFISIELTDGPFPPSGNVASWWATVVLKIRQLKS